MGHNSQASLAMLSVINDKNTHTNYSRFDYINMYRVYISWYCRCTNFDNDIMVPGGFVKIKKDVERNKSIKSSKNYINTRGREEMPATFQTIFSNAFCWMQIYEFRLRFQRKSTSFQLIIFQHRFRGCLGVDKATSYGLNQWWLVCWRTYVSLGFNELMKVVQWPDQTTSAIYFNIDLSDAFVMEYTLSYYKALSTFACMWLTRTIIMKKRIWFLHAQKYCITVTLGNLFLAWHSLYAFLLMHKVGNGKLHGTWRNLVTISLIELEEYNVPTNKWHTTKCISARCRSVK